MKLFKHSMDLARLDPELRGAARAVRTPPLGWGPTRRLTRALVRFAPSGDTSGVDISRPTPQVRLYRPKQQQAGAALFWIHGGGFVIGRASQDDRFCAAVARELGVVVASAEYRLAPEHPYPAPLDDCHEGWRWFRDHAAELGFDPSRLALGGQSAGGGLAAGLARRLLDQQAEPPAALWLFCPMLDDRTATHRDLDEIGHRVWDNRKNRIGWSSYLGADPGSAGVTAEAAPARADRHPGLPPTWIGVGDIDLFCAEDRAFADVLRRDGVDVTVDVVPGAPHGFESWAPSAEVTTSYLTRARGWLRDTLG